MSKKVLKKCLFWITVSICFIGLTLSGVLFFAWQKLQEEETQKYVAEQVISFLPDPWKSRAKCGRIGGRLPGHLFLEDLTLETPNGDNFKL